MSRQTSRLDHKKVNSELFTLTYGTLVTQLLKDYDNVEDVNKQLERMGYNIGVRLIEDFLARTSCGRCNDFKETAEKIQMGFKMFLGISPNISNWSPAGDEFSLIFDTNPLTEFVELPDNYLQLKYSNILPGILRGACEMVQMEVSSWFVQDQLKGDNFTELRVKFIKRLEDAIPAANHFHTLDGTTAYEIPTSDVFFEITDPKELAYTYKIRPAQDFGTTFNESFSAKNALLVPADPSNACDKLDNWPRLYKNVALVERGECSFLTKSINVEKAGAIAIIVSDYDKDNDELYIEMIDDNTLRPVNIPAGFLLGKNGYIIRSTLKKLNRNYALINLPVNITHLPLTKFNQPPWVGW